MKRSWLLKCLLLVSIVSQTRTESSECSVAQTALSEFCVCVSGSQLECSGLNSTAALRTLEASSVTRLDISQSHLPCLDLSDLADFDSLSSLSVTHSDLAHLLSCQLHPLVYDTLDMDCTTVYFTTQPA